MLRCAAGSTSRRWPTSSRSTLSSCCCATSSPTPSSDRTCGRNVTALTVPRLGRRWHGAVGDVLHAVGHGEGEMGAGPRRSGPAARDGEVRPRLGARSLGLAGRTSGCAGEDGRGSRRSRGREDLPSDVQPRRERRGRQARRFFSVVDRVDLERWRRLQAEVASRAGRDRAGRRRRRGEGRAPDRANGAERVPPGRWAGDHGRPDRPPAHAGLRRRAALPPERRGRHPAGHRRAAGRAPAPPTGAAAGRR